MPEDCIIGKGFLRGRKGLKASAYRSVLINGRLQQEHRVAREKANSPIPKGLCVCHHCDEPGCINVDHLFLGTQRENIQDASRKGRILGPRGEKNWNTKLTVDNVMQIKQMSGTQGEIASRFGVGQWQISKIKNNKQWRYLK